MLTRRPGASDLPERAAKPRRVNTRAACRNMRRLRHTVREALAFFIAMLGPITADVSGWGR